MSKSSQPDDKSLQRRLLLVDCDAFFVQVARLEDPEGAGKADLLIVGGTASGRGVVTSASYAAREYGVRSAMPTGQALRLCPDAMVAPVPRGACAKRSRDVRDTLVELSPVVQAASIDEFYLDLTGTERLFHHEPLTDSAERIRRTVLERTDIHVSLGGGSTRIIAKLATTLAKPAGVHVVAPGAELDFMRRFDLADIPGVGPSLAQSLKKRGLVRVEDALAVEEEWLVRWLGPSRGTWLHRRMRGIDRSAVTSGELRKSISSERTFFADLSEDHELEEILLKQTIRVGRILRRKDLRARTITVKIRDADFTTRQHSHTVPEPVETDQAIFAVARELLDELRRRRRAHARLLGVGLSNLIGEGGDPQMGLFDDGTTGESEKARVLTRAVDGLRERFGDQAVLPGRIVSPPNKNAEAKED